MKKVRVQDAVGMVLCHDMTEIVPGRFKGRAFKKGHVVMEEDIEKLLDIGKRYLGIDVHSALWFSVVFPASSRVAHHRLHGLHRFVQTSIACLSSRTSTAASGWATAVTAD